MTLILHVYKYYIPWEGDNHISRDDIFNYYPLKNVIFILLYCILFFYFLLGVGSSKGNTMQNC